MPKNNNTVLQNGFVDLVNLEADFFSPTKESFTDGLWCWNLKSPERGGISHKLCQLLGYKSSINDVVQVNFLSLVYEEDIEALQKIVQELIAHKAETAINLDVRLIHFEGHPLWFNLRGELIMDNSADTHVLFGAAFCIEKYKEQEKDLRIRKQHFKNVVKGANLGIWEGNLTSGKVVCNERWANMFGYTLSELEPLDYNTFLERVPQEDVKLIEATFENHVTENGIYEVEFRMHHKKGHWVWILSRGEITKYTQDGLPEIVSGIHYDITVRKTNEILMKKYKDLFERSGEVAKIGYWELDQQENTIFWSKVNKRIHEVSEDYIPTLDAGLNFYLEGENRDRIKKVISQSLLRPLEFDEQLQIKTQRGNVKWVRLIGVSEHKDNRCVKLYGLIQEIDEIKKVQLEIRIREEQFRQTFNHSSIGMALINGKNKVIKANKSFCQFLGYTEDELQQMDLENIAYPEDLKINRSYIEKLFRGKHKNIKLEHRFIHRDKSIIWANITMSAIHNDLGEIIHFVSQVQDITTRKQNELLLAHNTNIMNRINEAANIGIWELNFVTNTVYWSPTIKQMVSVPEDYVPTLEEVYTFFLEGEHRETLRKAIEIAIEEGKGFDLELQVITGEHRLFWSRTIGVPEMENGVCVRLYGFFQDIDEKARATRELAVKEEEFRRSFKHAAIGMLIIDLEGRLRKANPRICEILGYSETEILKKTIFDLADPKDLDSLKNMMVDIQRAEKGTFKLEKRCVHKNGGYVWVNAAIAAVKNDAGECTHLVAQVQDISDKKQLTENLTEHNNRLINFAHIVSHNLRSHTSNISMLLDLAIQDDSNVIKNEYFHNIKVVSDNMNETIYQLNEIVEINSKVSSTLTSQNLLKNVRKAIRAVDPLVKKSNAQIELEVDERINVLAVHAYLESIILNLITNALKYKSPDRPAILQIKSGSEGEYAFLSVADNGLGIDLNRHGAKLFGMYKTFHSHPEARGIGLFISKNQIEAMGGKITVESEVDKGTKFTTFFRII